MFLFLLIFTLLACKANPYSRFFFTFNNHYVSISIQFSHEYTMTLDFSVGEAYVQLWTAIG